MKTKTSVVVTTIAFFFLAGSAMAEVQQNQVNEATRFLQTDESAEFAAYEFETSSENSATDETMMKKTDSADDSSEWTPEIWSEIP